MAIATPEVYNLMPTGGAKFLSGTTIKDMVTGSVALAEFANVVATKYPTNVALLTDHCQKSWNGLASYGPTTRPKFPLGGRV